MNNKKSVLATQIAVPTILVIAFLWWQATLVNYVWVFFRGNPLFGVALLAVALSVSAPYVYAYVKSGKHYSSTYISRRHLSDTRFNRFKSYCYGKAIGELSIIIGVVVLALAIPTLFATTGYMRSSNVAESVKIVKPENGVAAFTDYNQRAPFSVASRQTQDNTTINGSPENTRYIPEADMFGAPVVKSGMIKGYGQVVWQKIDETGQAKTDSCSFSPKGQKRLGGSFNKSLQRAILRERYGVLMKKGDMFAYCDEDAPIVVVPLVKYGKGFFPAKVPAGVAIYNGETGKLVVRDNVKSGDYPGPVYPMSLAEAAQKSTRSVDGWWSYVTGETGYEEYGNASNSSNFNLSRADGKGHAFVTPLVMHGGGKAITSVGEVSSNESYVGKLNTYRVYTLPEARQGDSAVEARVKSDFAELEWATGMELFEIIPTGPTQWAATLGQKKSVMYRLLIESDGSSCVFSVKGEKIRCVGEKAEEVEVEVDKTKTGNKKKGDQKLENLSDKELRELADAILDEMNNRMKD